MAIRFGDYELHPELMQLHQGGEQVHIEPQVYDVLAYLIDNRDRLVPKEELLDEVWGDRFVSESALTSRIKAARQAVGDDGRTQAVISTAHGRGYRFIASVEEVDTADTGASPGTDAPMSSRPRAAPDPILGREAEIKALADALDNAALVTIVGPGGTGKTRLALEVSTGETVAGGTMVELATVEDPEAIPYAVATALGIQVGQRHDAVSACVEFLAATPHLLVLDNCEHILQASARLSQSLLDRCPFLTILATSREPLGLFAERVFRLQPLEVPSASTAIDPETAARIPAVELFAERASRVNSAFELDATTVGPVMELCRALDGLPLAIELAASRMGALELDDLVARLDKRLDLVGDERSAVGGRHRTLRSLLEWSYDLLSDDEQRMLRFLAAFPAGATLATIEWLGERLGMESDPTLALAHLVEASMVVRSRSQDLTHYRQLDTVQAFGRDQLEMTGESELARTLLMDWAIGFVADVDQGTRTADEGRWDRLARLAVPNLRAARRAMLDGGDLAGAVQIAQSLVDWLQFRDLEELHVWNHELYELTADADQELRTIVLAAEGSSAWARGDHETAIGLADEVLGGNPDPWSLARAMSARAVCSMYQGDLEAAQEGWVTRVELDGSPLDAVTMALPLAYLGRIDEAWATLEAGIARSVEAGWPSVDAWALYVRGEIEHESGDPVYVEHLEQAVAEAEAVGAAFMAGVAKVTLVSGQFRSGDLERAAQGFLELINAWLRAGNWSQMWVTLRNVAELLLGIDDETSLLLWAAADADPFATAMTGRVRSQVAAWRDEAASRVGAERLAEIEARTVGVDRTAFAEAAARALRAYLGDQA